MVLLHLHVTQVRRSAGQSAVACAAYRAGEKLFSEYYGEVSDFTSKGGVICSGIFLPTFAPAEYQDRAVLWNTVEKVERNKDAQLAYSFDIALQNEFSIEENIALAKRFVSEQLIARGMIADFAIHQPDKEDGGIPNPHFHVLCPIRPIKENGKWGYKQRRVYRLDEGGSRIMGKNGTEQVTTSQSCRAAKRFLYSSKFQRMEQQGQSGQPQIFLLGHQLSDRKSVVYTGGFIAVR